MIKSRTSRHSGYLTLAENILTNVDSYKTQTSFQELLRITCSNFSKIRVIGFQKHIADAEVRSEYA